MIAVSTQTKVFNITPLGTTKRTMFMGIKSIKSDKQFRELTGVSSNVYALLLTLFDVQYERYSELNTKDKLLLCLMKLNMGISFASLAVIFGIHRSTASRIFGSCINQLYGATKTWIKFPSQETTRKTLPLSFKKDYPNCRVIIDCTEIRTETPNTNEQRIHLWSHYKSGYTAKYLLGIAPSGLITFLSKGYGGRATDCYITNECGILDMLEEGDVVLADKGFPNVVVNDGVIIVMPPFAKANNFQFTEEQNAATYDIASVRIHVERAIQRIKLFNILNIKCTTELFPILDEIMHVLCVITNLGPPLIREK